MSTPDPAAQGDAEAAPTNDPNDLGPVAVPVGLTAADVPAGSSVVVVDAQGHAQVRTTLPEPTSALQRFTRRRGWVVGVALLFVILLAWRFSQLDGAGLSGDGLARTEFQLRTLTAGSLALILLAMAQGVVVISGGIDLSVGAMLVLANCVAARFMEGQPFETCLLIGVGVLVVTVLLATAMGWVISESGIPDIIVTLAASFVYSGLALWIIGGPGGGTAPEFQRMLVGGLSEPLPSVIVILVVLVLIWVPFARSRLGTAIYAIGSDRRAAFLAGVPVRRTRILAYAVGGFFSGLAGLVTTAYTGVGEPRESIGAGFTLLSVAAVVLGGVLLSGGVGGLIGPAFAALSLSLIPAILLGLGVDSNLSEVARGIIIIVVVAVGGYLSVRRGAT